MEHGSPKPTAAALVHEQYQAVYRFAYRLSRSPSDAEDLTQQTFLVACGKLDDLRELDRARSWLFTIVRNLYLRTRRPAEMSAVSIEDTGELAADPDWESPFDSERLAMALDELPDVYRLPLLLYYFEDLPYKEISNVLGVPMGTVMSRLARGKEHLRNTLGSPEQAGYVDLP